jgi:hypothetical protein
VWVGVFCVSVCVCVCVRVCVNGKGKSDSVLQHRVAHLLFFLCVLAMLLHPPAMYFKGCKVLWIGVNVYGCVFYKNL